MRAFLVGLAIGVAAVLATLYFYPPAKSAIGICTASLEQIGSLA